MKPSCISASSFAIRKDQDSPTYYPRISQASKNSLSPSRERVGVRGADIFSETCLLHSYFNPNQYQSPSPWPSPALGGGYLYASSCEVHP